MKLNPKEKLSDSFFVEGEAPVLGFIDSPIVDDYVTFKTLDRTTFAVFQLLRESREYGTNYSKITNKNIMSFLNIGRMTVFRSIKKLEDNGFIKVRRVTFGKGFEHKNFNEYHFLPPEVWGKISSKEVNYCGLCPATKMCICQVSQLGDGVIFRRRMPDMAAILGENEVSKMCSKCQLETIILTMRSPENYPLVELKTSQNDGFVKSNSLGKTQFSDPNLPVFYDQKIPLTKPAKMITSVSPMIHSSSKSCLNCTHHKNDTQNQVLTNTAKVITSVSPMIHSDIYIYLISRYSYKLNIYINNIFHDFRFLVDTRPFGSTIRVDGSRGYLTISRTGILAVRNSKTGDLTNEPFCGVLDESPEKSLNVNTLDNIQPSDLELPHGQIFNLTPVAEFELPEVAEKMSKKKNNEIVMQDLTPTPEVNDPQKPVDIFAVTVPSSDRGKKIDNNGIKAMDVNSVISWFEEVVPGEFLKARAKNTDVYANTSVRSAISGLIKLRGMVGIRQMLDLYLSKDALEDNYRPVAGTIVEFCTVKLAKIENFVNKVQRGKVGSRADLSPNDPRRITYSDHHAEKQQQVLDEYVARKAIESEKRKRAYYRDLDKAQASNPNLDIRKFNMGWRWDKSDGY